MSLSPLVRKACWLLSSALVVSGTAQAASPDPTLLASFKNSSVPVTGRYQGGFCKSIIHLPAGHVGYADPGKTRGSLSKPADNLTLLLGDQRMIVFHCAAPQAEFATPEKFIASMRNGKVINHASVVVRAITLAGLPATRVDCLLIDPASIPASQRSHQTAVMALEKLKSGVNVQHFWTMITTSDHLSQDEVTLDALLTGYQISVAEDNVLSTPKN